MKIFSSIFEDIIVDLVYLQDHMLVGNAGVNIY